MHSFEVHSNESACRKKVCLGLEQVFNIFPNIFVERSINFFIFDNLIYVTCKKLVGDDLSGIGRPEPTFWNARNSAPFLPSSSAAFIIDGQVSTSDIKQQVRLSTIGASLCNHTIKQDKWMSKISDSVDWDSVTTAMSKEPNANQVRIDKFSHGWLSKQRNMKHCQL